MRSLQIEILPPAALRPYLRNARIHPKRQIKKIAESIRQIGFVNPILIDEHEEIIAGHGRLMAANSLGLDAIPVIRIRDLSEAQKRALRIADNRLALDSSWSSELLAEELEELASLDFDLTLTGFDTIEIDRLTTPSYDQHEDEDELVIPRAIVAQAGDLWACGDHRLLCADARQTSSYETVLNGRLADMVFTDPPYNVPIAGHVSGNGKVKHAEFRMASGEMSTAQFEDFLNSSLSLSHNFSRDGSLHYVFGDWRMIGQLTRIGEAVIGPLFNIAVWVKPNGAMGSFYRSQHELVAIFKNGNAHHTNNVQLGRMGRYRTNVWQYPGASGFSKARKQDLEDHPTVKPLLLVADAIRDATNPGDMILDPFGGAGTTLIAAEIAGRKAALIEIEPKFIDVTLRRFEERFESEPCLLPDKVPLSVVRDQRLGEQTNG